MNIEIIEYEDRYHDKFRSLNLVWLDKYNLTEEPDLLVLNDPRGTIINKGGYIWLARHEGDIIGSSALIKEHEGVFELAKMSVAELWRGKGISKLLIEVCLKKAGELGASKVELFSNHQLLAALKLYERYGFRYVDIKDSPFATADVKMELAMKSSTL
jgi:N-acetylglutamate synthase-like GNAT family acetyltransferase